jgi:hypothetical protein
LLDGIADELHRQADAGMAEIMREFAAAMQEARRRAPRHELSATLAALKRRRRSALALARHKAAVELKERRRLGRLGQHPLHHPKGFLDVGYRLRYLPKWLC